MTTLHLLIIESHPAVRQALVTRLRSVSQIAWVKTAVDLKDATAQIASHKPDVVLLGLSHRLNGDLKTVATQISQLAAVGMRVLVLAPYANDLEREVLLRAGAAKYLLKTIDTTKLIQAILTPCNNNLPVPA